MPKPILPYTLLLPVIILLASCDPMYKMVPVGMEKVEGTSCQWRKKFDGFVVEISSMEGIDTSGISVRITINTSSESIAVEKVKLRTARGIYPAQISRKSIVLPHKAILHVYWNEDGRPSRILGDSSKILLYLKIGGKERIAEIAYENFY